MPITNENGVPTVQFGYGDVRISLSKHAVNDKYHAGIILHQDSESHPIGTKHTDTIGKHISTVVSPIRLVYDDLNVDLDKAIDSIDVFITTLLELRQDLVAKKEEQNREHGELQ